LSVPSDVLHAPPAARLGWAPLHWVAFVLVCGFLASPMIAYVIERGF